MNYWLKPPPMLTVAVLLLTVVVTALALFGAPGLGEALERSPRIVTEGQAWRLITAWLIEPEGAQQMAVNLAGLALFGTLVERVAGRGWWLLGYVGAGVIGEIAGLFWQPYGGGNSVAVCGLIGIFAVWLMQRQKGIGRQRLLGVVIWLGGAIWLTAKADMHGPALLFGLAIGALVFQPWRSVANG